MGLRSKMGGARRRSTQLAAAGLTLAAAGSPLSAGTSALAIELQAYSQKLADAYAPGDRKVWAQRTDPSFVYVTEDNEVKPRDEWLADLKPLPAGSAGWIAIEDFRCQSFGNFATTTFVLHEHETIQGHSLQAWFRQSDTWRQSGGQWRLVATQVFAIPQDPPTGNVRSEDLAQYEGQYRLSDQTHLHIRREGDHLVSERADRPPQVLLPEVADVFFTPGRPRTRRIFLRDASGALQGFADRREGIDLVWVREAEAPPH